ncbi:hypothetical protein FBU59_006103 [Linderina macrospora]|uniref:Uncharacterized protein n=1 Tax=Linderina macrospora TaxID=4868 RepID=A0ACC1J0V4_9FUNG|nr:hypothetical protein FBU59_006103 [Linderina macrospora]
MTTLMTTVDSDVKARLTKDMYRTEEEQNYEFLYKRGQDVLLSIIEDEADAVRENIKEMCPELADAFIIDAYGRYISSDSILPMKETELCIIAAITPLKLEAYVAYHVKGSAIYGASKDEISAASAIGNLALNART